MQSQLDCLEYYSNRENFLESSLFSYMPNVYEDVTQTDKAWVIALYWNLVEKRELWSNFLDTVEFGFNLLASEGFTFPLGIDARAKMLIASRVAAVYAGEK